MRKIDKIKKKINNYLFDHLILREVLSSIKMLVFCATAAFLFAFGFTAFVTPYNAAGGDIPIITGGVSGLSQNIYLIITFFNPDVKLTDVTSICYFIINIPIVLFAFFGIGKKFGVFTFINVLLSSLFIRFFPNLFTSEIQKILSVADGAISPYGGIITRVLFGAVCVGTSTAIAFRGEHSCGGMDVITYYFALRKSTSVGKYSVALNGGIMLLYTLLSISKNPSDWEHYLLMLLFSITYLFICAFVIDFINVRNKKVQVQIITTKPFMSDVLLANFPHSATIVDGKGAYSHTERFIIYMVISSVEVKQVVALTKKVDDHVFVSVIPLNQVYGNFFIKPVE